MATVNLKGSSLVEVLAGMVIISVVFGLTITFFSNRNHSNSLKDFKNILELNRFQAEGSSLDLEDTFESTSFIFRDGLCEIIIVRALVDSNARNTIIQVNPIRK